MQEMHSRSHTPPAAPAEQGRGTEGSSGQPAGCWGRAGGIHPTRQLMGDSFCNCWRMEPVPSPGTASTAPGGTRGQEGHSRTGQGQEEPCTQTRDEHRAQGWLGHPRYWQSLLQRHRAALDPSRIPRVEKREGAGLSPIPTMRSEQQC